MEKSATTITFRIGPDSLDKIDRLVASGKFKDRTDVLRAALGGLFFITEQEREGRVVLSMLKKEAKRLGIAIPVPA